MNSNLRLRLAKLLVNVPVRLLDRFIPEREPTFPQTKIAAKMFERMFQAYRLEQAQGVFKERGNFGGDGNFERLLKLSRKLLFLVSEDDRYYREWLGLLVILAYEEYQVFLNDLTPEELCYWCNAQWYMSPDMLPREAVEELKGTFAPTALASYLYEITLPKYQKLLLPRQKPTR